MTLSYTVIIALPVVLWGYLATILVVILVSEVVIWVYITSLSSGMILYLMRTFLTSLITGFFWINLMSVVSSTFRPELVSK